MLFRPGGVPHENTFWGRRWLRTENILLHVLQTLPTFIWAPHAGPVRRKLLFGTPVLEHFLKTFHVFRTMYLNYSTFSACDSQVWFLSDFLWILGRLEGGKSCKTIRGSHKIKGSRIQKKIGSRSSFWELFWRPLAPKVRFIVIFRGFMFRLKNHKIWNLSATPRPVKMTSPTVRFQKMFFLIFFLLLWG